MNRNEFTILVKRDLADDVTDTERHFVEAYYAQMGSTSTIEDILAEDEIAYMATNIADNIKSRINFTEKTIVRKLYWKKYAAVAAVIFAIVSVGLLFIIKRWNTTAANLVFNSYYTKPGNLSKIALSDGTVVWLNADSKFRCPQSFDGAATREVFLEGEAYFEVAKDKKHPFLVHSGNLTTRVLGTKFDVNAYHTNKTIEVTLVEGKVMLTANADIAQHKKPDTLYLKPNEKAYFNKDNSIVKSVSNIQVAIKTENRDTGEKTAYIAKEVGGKLLSKTQVENAAIVTSWKDGRLNFDKEPLENVIATLNRKYDVEIDAKVGLLSYPVTLDIGNEPVENVLLAITKQLKHHDNKRNIQADGEGQF